MSGEWWSVMTIVGPIVLALGLLWAIAHNRRSRRERDRTEAGTRRLYTQEEARLHDKKAGRPIP